MCSMAVLKFVFNGEDLFYFVVSQLNGFSRVKERWHCQHPIPIIMIIAITTMTTKTTTTAMKTIVVGGLLAVSLIAVERAITRTSDQIYIIYI